MDDAPTGREQVAFALTQLCITREGPTGFPTRKEVLALYAACLRTVRTAKYDASIT